MFIREPSLPQTDLVYQMVPRDCAFAIASNPRGGFKNRLVARLTRCKPRRGKRAKKPEVYPLRYAEDFFAEFDEVAACISSAAADDIFETTSERSC